MKNSPKYEKIMQMYLNEDALAVDVSNQSSILVYTIYMNQKWMPFHKTVQERLGLLAVRLAALRCIHTPVEYQNGKSSSETPHYDKPAAYKVNPFLSNLVLF